MLLQNQAAQVAVRLATQHAQHTSTWAAILANQAHRQRAQAVLLHLAYRYLANLPEYVIKVFGVQTEARQVTISASQQRHILQRRQVVSRIDADLCAYRLAEALQHLTHWVQPSGIPGCTR
jgi:ABC-type sulfate transport system substrate-binding protein